MVLSKLKIALIYDDVSHLKESMKARFGVFLLLLRGLIINDKKDVQIQIKLLHS